MRSVSDTLGVRRYIHPQSLITRAYFERLLCLGEVCRPDKKTTSCLQVRLGDERECQFVFEHGLTRLDADSYACRRWV